MEVIFDTPNLKPRLSPTMRTTLSVISLIANSLIEANKCMKERLADEAGPPTTLDQVMQQSGLKIPGLEEALARLMGGGDDAKQAASMIVNTPDPVKLLQTFAASYGSAPSSAEPQKSGPIVTPPPAAAANTPPAAGAAAPSLAPFRADFTREGREAAKAAAASTGLPQYRPDFTREGRQTAQAHITGPGQSVTEAGAAGRLALVGGVTRQLDTIRRQRKSFEDMVFARMVALEAELAKLRYEFDQLHTALLSKAESKAEVAAADSAAVAVLAETVAVDAATADTMTADDALVAARTTAVVDASASANVDAALIAAQPTDAATVDALPPAGTAEEVVQAIELIEEFAAETTAAEAQQLARIAAAEREVARMRDLVQSAREAHAGARGDTAAHG